MRLGDCEAVHLEPIRSIVNGVIASSTALYEYVPRSAEAMARWFEAKQAAGLPVLGLFADDGALMGFASYGPFRPFPAFKYTVEHTVYVAEAHRGQGVGARLIQALIARAEIDEVHAMIGAIDSANHASVAMHERLGFTRVGTLPEVGFKFGRWLDLCLYQRLLPGPRAPVDG